MGGVHTGQAEKPPFGGIHICGDQVNGGPEGGTHAGRGKAIGVGFQSRNPCQGYTVGLAQQGGMWGGRWVGRE